MSHPPMAKQKKNGKYPRTGFSIKALHITWLDLWTGTRGLEIAWGNPKKAGWRHKCLIDWGFKDKEGNKV